jgi:hypothetical protein
VEPWREVRERRVVVRAIRIFFIEELVLQQRKGTERDETKA